MYNSSSDFITLTSRVGLRRGKISFVEKIRKDVKKHHLFSNLGPQIRNLESTHTIHTEGYPLRPIF